LIIGKGKTGVKEFMPRNIEGPLPEDEDKKWASLLIDLDDL